MQCRRYVPGPEIYHPDRFCDCDSCADDDRRVALISDLEVSLRRPLVQLLDFGVMPDEIAAAVRARTHKKSKAWMLTRCEITHQAGYWLSRPDWSVQLAQADQLAKHTGCRVGLTIPGWLHDWSNRRGWTEDAVLTAAVTDVWMAMAPELETSSACARPEDGAWDLVAGRPSLPRNVVRFPVSGDSERQSPWQF